MKTVELASGKWILYPIKVFCSVSIKEANKRLFQLPNFGLSGALYRMIVTECTTYMMGASGKIFRLFQSSLSWHLLITLL